ncbi:MAG: MaoC family dehydratase N-terminal domain-containing protein [Chloroflexi bacterium]|nr:MaoC family dehydratase N-terminal domain-containing protein [Chloroflexota bacterium]
MPGRDAQRYWDDLQVGEQIPGRSIYLTPTEFLIANIGGNVLDLIHHDREYTQSGGHADYFMHTPWYNGHFGHLLSDLVGLDGWIWKMSQQMRRMNLPGDTTTFAGKVTRKYQEGGDHLADLDLWAENQREGVTTQAQATVALPTRGGWKPGFPEPAEVYKKMSPTAPQSPAVRHRPWEDLRTPEEYLEEDRKFIGWESAPRTALYPVEYQPLRNFCRMTRDDNPLYTDPEYGKTTRFGSVICPPGFGVNFGGGVWPPPDDAMKYLSTADRLFRTAGTHPVNMQSAEEFYLPVRPGDRITSKTRQEDVYMKSIRVDPKAFWSATATVSWNQNGEIVRISRGLFMSHRSPEEVRAAGE